MVAGDEGVRHAGPGLVGWGAGQGGVLGRADGVTGVQPVPAVPASVVRRADALSSDL